jgi:hypothetical protein
MDDPVEIATEHRNEQAERRRSALVGIAAVVVLALVVGAGVALARAGEEGPAGPGGADTYVLPPTDAEVLFVSTQPRDRQGSVPTLPVDGDVERVASYSLIYREPDGRTLWLGAQRLPGNIWYDTVPPTVPSAYPASPEEALRQAGLLFEVSPVAPLDGLPMTHAVVTCSGVRRLPPVDGKVGPPAPGGVPIVVGLLGTAWGIRLSPPPVDGPLPPCTADLDEARPTVDAAERLRFVDAATWRAFMEDHADLSRLPEELGGPPSEGSRVEVPTPTVPSVPIPDEDRARAAVVAAFEGLDLQAADGTYPNVETGDDVAFWQPFFEEAAATPQITTPGGFTVDEVAFVSEERAHVRFQAHAEKDGQEIHVRLTGEAVRIGDRWYVSRETMVQLLNGAVSGDRRR